MTIKKNGSIFLSALVLLVAGITISAGAVFEAESAIGGDATMNAGSRSDDGPTDDTGAWTAELVTFAPDKSHSQVGFKIRHLGISNVRGEFTEYDAVVRFDPGDITTLAVEATVDVGSIDTGVERRDNHLRSDDFFNAEQYPAMRFVSREVRNIDGDEFELVGDLTIRDVTKEVVFDVEFAGTAMARNGRKAGFEAQATINRFDYNLKWDRLTETGGLVASEDVDINLELELNEIVADAPAN